MAHLHHEMESFLPSEIARLVYGYLEEEECNDAAQAFLETSLHLKECLAVSRKGRKFSTKIYGLSLVDLFDLLTETLCLVKENSKVLKETSSISSRLLSLLHSDSGISDSVIKDHNAEISDDSFMAKDHESIDLENQQIRNVYPGKNTSVKNDSSLKQNDLDNKEVPSFLCTGQVNQISEKDGFSPHFIKIKEENETEDIIEEIKPEVNLPLEMGSDVISKAAITTVSNATFKRSEKRYNEVQMPHSTWWTEELEQLRKNTNLLRKRYQRIKHDAKLRNQMKLKYLESRIAYRKLTRKTKLDHGMSIGPTPNLDCVEKRPVDGLKPLMEIETLKTESADNSQYNGDMQNDIFYIE